MSRVVAPRALPRQRKRVRVGVRLQVCLAPSLRQEPRSRVTRRRSRQTRASARGEIVQPEKEPRVTLAARSSASCTSRRRSLRVWTPLGRIRTRACGRGAARVQRRPPGGPQVGARTCAAGGPGARRKGGRRCGILSSPGRPCPLLRTMAALMLVPRRPQVRRVRNGARG